MFRLLYYLYARRLVREVRSRPTPRHVGIILDGNRRHGRSLGITEPRELYDLGANKLDEVLEWCADLGIPTVTLWVFSTDNFHRPAAEVSGILASIEAKLTALACDPRSTAGACAFAQLAAFPCSRSQCSPRLRQPSVPPPSMDGVELNIAVAYGGRQEIADAVRALLGCMATKQTTLAEAMEEVTPEAIASHLYTAGLPDPDLIIRTSGEIRLSGFLLWQSAHSEFYFTDVLWPAFRKIDFLRAIRSFQQRRRRYGC